MIRSRPWLTLMHRLALLAALLMLVAPLVSRGVQAQRGVAVGELCTAEGLVRAALPFPAAMPETAPHARHDGAGAVLPAGHPAGQADPGHAAHGEACDYCVLAARLLPWLAVALVLAPLPRAPAPVFPFRTLVPNRLGWRAHAARGPPLYA